MRCNSSANLYGAAAFQALGLTTVIAVHVKSQEPAIVCEAKRSGARYIIEKFVEQLNYDNASIKLMMCCLQAYVVLAIFLNTGM
jgi:hypothetical protein